MLFAYFGPETMLPLASVIATVLGAMMMFGRASFRLALGPFSWVFKQTKRPKTGMALRGPTAWRRGQSATNVEATAPAHETAEEA